jgi:hypothetical protein
MLLGTVVLVRSTNQRSSKNPIRSTSRPMGTLTVGVLSQSRLLMVFLAPALGAQTSCSNSNNYICSN